jgi:hypothetical protein
MATPGARMARPDVQLLFAGAFYNLPGPLHVLADACNGVAAGQDDGGDSDSE